MAFALRPGKPIKRELKRLARGELADAAARLAAHAGEDDVHESRKSVKKVEALARLLEELGFTPPRKDLERLRAAKRALSRLRDADVTIETFDRLRSHFPRRIPSRTSTLIRTHFERNKAELVRRAAARAGSLARARKTLRRVQRSVKHWSAPSTDVAELPEILRRSIRASRKAMKRAQVQGRPPDFHEWRKRVKVLWYQLRLAERLVAGLRAQIDRFERLDTTLGDEHNLAVLRTRLTRDRALRHIRSDTQRLALLSKMFERELQRRALLQGRRLHQLPPKAFAKDLQRRLRPAGTGTRKAAPGAAPQPPRH